MGKKHKKHHKKTSETKEKTEEPPIKLVLKVGSAEKTPPEPKVKERELINETQKTKEHSSKKKKKKRSSSKDRKKRKHVDSVEDQGFDSSSTIESTHEKPRKKAKTEERKLTNDGKPIITKIHIKPIEPPKIRESKRPKPQDFHDMEPSPVLLCLANLHQTLQRKDVNGFFAYPVNDVMAPGYSSIITNPMDFSTMKYKMDIHAYTSLEEFRDDFNVMCNNAMIYNTPETVYFKAAKKLQLMGAKMMSAEKFHGLYRAMGLTPPENIASSRHEDELIDVDTVDSSSTPLLPTPKKKENKTKKRNTVSQRIQAKAEEAARKAAEKLAKKYPNSNIGFLRKDADGNTTLAILNPCSVDEPQSIPVNLGAVTGKLTTGSLSTALLQEDKKNKASPVSYLKYGPFSSFSPSFDSSMATITKEDSDLLHSTYGDSTGAYYAQSLQAFVKDNVFAKDYADHVLDALTDGAHSKLMAKLQKQLEEEEEKERKKEEDLAKAAKNETAEDKKPPAELSVSDFNALLSLEKEGIDMSFLKPNETAKSEETKDVQRNLDKTADLLKQLDAAQSERLSQASEDVNGATPKSALTPSENEQQIAEKVTQELSNLTSKVKPKDVLDNESVRKATGVGDVSEILRKGKEQDEMEVQLAAEAIETVFNDATTMEDLDKVICEAAREVEDAMGLDVLDELTASLDDVKQMDVM